MLFDITIDDTMVGEMLSPSDGFLVSLSMVTPGIFDGGSPRWNAATQRWTSGYFCLRGQHDARDLVSLEMGNAAFSWADGVGRMIVNSSLPFRGALIVRSVPRGAVFEMTLSDQPFVKTIESFEAYIERLRSSQQAA